MPRDNENPILSVTNLTQEEVRNRLNKIKIDKSPGPDGIHPRVLRELSNIKNNPDMFDVYELVMTWRIRIAFSEPSKKAKQKTNDTKLCKAVNTREDSILLQIDLDKLETWAERWQMRFNNDKCKVIHMGRRNQYHHYTLNGKPLGKSDREKDSGILVNDKLTWSSQCQAAAAKANRIMGCIKRGLDTHDESIILPLYKSLVTPHVEYCVQLRAPVLRKVIMELERVKKRATKLINEMGEPQYPERLYLINSPVVRAENLRFKEEGVRDVLKDVFLPWYNAFRFLMQNIYRLQKEDSVQFLYAESSAKPSGNMMDKWILSFTQSLICFFKAEMTAYRLYTVVPRLVRFVDMLTNWYVRMNRRRLKGESGTEDCLMALETLFSVLFSMCRLMAPFTPFITEMMHQKLKLLLDPASVQEKDSQSIHYLLLPSVREDLIDKKIENAVSWMQSVIELGRVIRDRRTLPIKYPLKEVVVIHQDMEALADIKSLEKYILEELNVRNVTVSTDKTKYGIRMRAEPDHMVLGKRLKGAFKSIMAAIKELKSEQLEQFQKAGSMMVEGHELHAEDVRLLYTFEQSTSGSSAQFEAHSDAQVLVLLDVTPDQAMVDEGVAREGNLVPTDEISIYYQVQPQGGYLNAVIQGHTNFILATVKSPLLPYPVSPSSSVIIKETTQLKGSDLEITLVRGSPHAMTGPACAFIKLNIAINTTEQGGFLLLENPKGAAMSSLSELRSAVSRIFQLEIAQLSVYDGDKELASDANLLSLHGKMLCVTSGPAPLVPSLGAPLDCQYVNLRLLGTDAQGTLLLQNPVGKNVLNYQRLSHEVARVFGLRSRRFRLYLDAAMSGELPQATRLPDLHAKTLFVHLLPTTAEC
ncbi:unnamed protein product [Ranitomeya imitator]|uniref:Uncharacterized protein n=1 Tax=Ranitomeya imitator TaxID=111125 RepID=A0ABN9LNF0_9NEOB|nr:unnamed protein product [Ranitomeya imitator]